MIDIAKLARELIGEGAQAIDLREAIRCASNRHLLRAKLSEHGWTQRELARRSHVTPAAISAACQSGIVPDRLRSKLARALKVKTEVFQ